MSTKEMRLISAASQGDHQDLKSLINMGAYIDATDVNGSTALLIATQKHHTRCVKILLDAGASPNALNKENKSALEIASDEGYNDLVKLLTKANITASMPHPKKRIGVIILNIIFFIFILVWESCWLFLSVDAFDEGYQFAGVMAGLFFFGTIFLLLFVYFSEKRKAPNIDKLERKHDIRGLSKVLGYPKWENIKNRFSQKAIKQEQHYVPIHQAAVEALGRIATDHAVEALVIALKSDSSTVREAIVKALIKIGSPSAFKALVVALEDRRHDVQGKVAEALGEIGDDRAIEPLMATLENPHYVVPWEALNAFKKIGTERALEAAANYNRKYEQRIQTEVEQLVEMLLKPNDSERYHAINKIKGGLASQALRPILTTLMKENDRQRRSFLWWAIREELYNRPINNTERALFAIASNRLDEAASIGITAITPLVAALKDDNAPQVQRAIRKAHAQIEQHDHLLRQWVEAHKGNWNHDDLI